MVLERFRQEDLQWDIANKTFYKKQIANTSDQRGRSLQVQILENGSLVDLSGLSLSLSWQTKDKKHIGLDEFSVSNAEAGIFKIYYTTGMLSNMGELDANLVLIGKDFRLVSRKFEIEVESGINEGAIQSSDSFTTLQNALNRVVRIIDGTENIAVLEDGSVDTDALADFVVTPPKIAESTWSTIDIQETLNNFDENPHQDNILTTTGASVSGAVIGENSEITVSGGGYYFFMSFIQGKLKAGEKLSVAIKVSKDTANAIKGFEFRNVVDALDGYPIDLIDARNGWYVLENITIPTGATNVRVRIDNRGKTGETVIEKYFMQISDRLIANSVIDSKVSEIERKLPNQSTFPIEATYKYPQGFKWVDNPLAHKITTNGKGDFYTDFDVADFKVVGKSYFVDPVNGDDSYSGSSTYPFKSINVALDQPDIKELHLMEGVYPRLHSMSKSTYTGDLSIIGHGEVYITSNSPSVFSKSATYANVYEATRGGFGNYAVDTSIKNGGLPLPMIKVNSVAEVNSTPNSYYHDGTKLYIRTYDDRNITGYSNNHDLILSSAMLNTIFEGNMDLYIENVTIYGSTNPLYARTTSSNDVLRVFGKNSNFLFSGDENKDAVMLQGTTLSIFQNCKAGYSLKDGFNYHAKNGIIPKSIEINCQGFENGNDTDDNDQGSTTHDGGSIIRIGGAYYRNKGANIAEDATGNTGTESLNLGVVCFEAKAPSDVRAVNFDCYDGVSMWIDGCVGYGSPYDIGQKGGNGQLKIRNCNLTTLEQLDGQRIVETY